MRPKYSSAQWDKIIALHVQNGCSITATLKAARANHADLAHLGTDTVRAYLKSDKGAQHLRSALKAHQEKIQASMDSKSAADKEKLSAMSIRQMWAAITKDALARGMAGDIAAVRLGIELLRVGPCVPLSDPGPDDDHSQGGGHRPRPNPRGWVPAVDEDEYLLATQPVPPVGQASCLSAPASDLPAESEPRASANANSAPPTESEPRVSASGNSAPAPAPAPAPKPATPPRPPDIPANWIYCPKEGWHPKDEDDYPPWLIPPRLRKQNIEKGTAVVVEGYQFRWGIDPWPKRPKQPPNLSGKWRYATRWCPSL